MRRPTRMSTAVLVALAGAASLVATGIAAPAAVAQAADPSTDVVYSVHPLKVKAPFGPSDVAPDLTPAQCLAHTGGVAACQDPASIRAAYDIPTTVNGALAGTGQTIVIVDAYGSPTVQQDLQAFDAVFALPAATLNVVYPTGRPTWQGTREQLDWASETDLDVQWAHAVAPGATIDLVIGATPSGRDLDLAEQYAVDNHLGNVMSMSFGIAESAISANSGHVAQAHAVYQDAQAAGISLFASSADDGSDNGAGYGNFTFPASDPVVTAVGGTDLWLGSGLNRSRETVWGDYANCPITCALGPFGATGGAPSILGGKDGSDVSYDGSVYTGVLTYLGFYGGADNGLYISGGTSAGSPQWAAITAVVDQAVGHSIGTVRDRAAGWARSGALFDVTQGSNSTPTFSGGYSATKGADLPTGYGTPDVKKLIALSQ